MNSPLLSIVIANYNYGRFLSDAIESVISQGMDDMVELIICDAASTDNSTKIIKRYESKLAWWCSEHDSGQSEAFNKGFRHANGRFLTWLNADDILLPGALKRFGQAVEENPVAEWFGGGCLYLDPNLRVFKCGRGRRISSLRASRGKVGVTGPSSFFSNRLYHSVGCIDERFQYTMDTNLWVKFALIAKAHYVPFARYVWGMRMHSDAKMSGHKFTKDGRILDGKESRDAFMKNIARLEQLRREAKWTQEDVQLEFTGMTWLERMLSSDLIPAAMSRFDTWRFRGKHYQEISI